MLGKLARWLRILGQDVEYSNNLDDTRLITISKKERRILLTRDLELYKQAMAKGADTFYLRGQTGEEKLAEVARRFSMKLNVNMRISRCPKCNTRVKPILKEDVAGKVKRNTFDCYEEFWNCPECGQVYWQGAHWAGIEERLEKARQCLNAQNNK